MDISEYYVSRNLISYIYALKLLGAQRILAAYERQEINMESQ
jgi:hypothetical protein